MSQPAKVFATSWRHLLREITIGAIVIPVVVTGAMLLTQGIESWIVAVPVGLFFGLLAFCYYAWRFNRRGVESVELDDEKITVQLRSGHVQRLAWAKVQSAGHESSYGLHWMLHAADGDLDVTLRDDGFGVRQWTEICQEIGRHLDAHGIAYSSEGFAAAFDEE